MKDEQIVELIKKHGLDIGMRPPPRIVEIGDGMMGLRVPDRLTPFGENLMALCRELAGGEP